MVVPILNNDKLSPDEKIHDAEARPFEIRAKLERLLPEEKNINIDFHDRSGDSFISASGSKLLATMILEKGKFVMGVNDSGRLSSIKYTCSARSGDEAKQIFHDMVMPFIDSFSFFGNIPIFISQISIEDLKHKVKGTYIRVPHQDVALTNFAANIPVQLFPVMALYREAKNAHSCYYKFLCYYKIIEGFISYLQPTAMSQAKKKGIVVGKIKIVIQDVEDMHEDLRLYVGKSIQKCFNEYVTPMFRNSVAHFNVKDLSPIITSDAIVEKKYFSILGIMEVACRDYISAYIDVYNLINTFSEK